ncbi:MAG: methyltransferase family protein [Candidatus Hodarchaeales archaeon]|jgi:protein-S-isoprenylcysteine O-methyltransferase Ste14
MNQLRTFLKSVIFTIFVLGIVTFGVSWVLSRIFDQTLDLDIFSWTGIIIFFLGLFVYLSTVFSFFQSQGTPMIFFMKKVKAFFGTEPNSLVSQGFYRFSRNPMYFSVFLMILGLGFVSQYLIVILWSFFFFLLVHLVVVFVEEPHLKEKHGDEYMEYLKSTPRWFGFSKK